MDPYAELFYAIIDCDTSNIRRLVKDYGLNLQQRFIVSEFDRFAFQYNDFRLYPIVNRMEMNYVSLAVYLAIYEPAHFKIRYGHFKFTTSEIQAKYTELVESVEETKRNSIVYTSACRKLDKLLIPKKWTFDDMPNDENYFETILTIVSLGCDIYATNPYNHAEHSFLHQLINGFWSVSKQTLVYEIFMRLLEQGINVNSEPQRPLINLLLTQIHPKKKEFRKVKCFVQQLLLHGSNMPSNFVLSCTKYYDFIYDWPTLMLLYCLHSKHVYLIL
jgi:hypothetical protein